MGRPRHVIDATAMTGPGAAALGALMLAAFALAGGGGYLLATGRGERRQAVLMLVAAAVFAVNVAIWAA